MLSLHQTVSTAKILGYETIAGLGTGLAFQISLGITSFGRSNVDRLDTAMLQTLSQQTGILLALGLSGCIFQNVGFHDMQNTLRGRGFSDQDIREALAGLTSPIWTSSTTEVANLAAHSVITTMVKLFYLPLSASVLGLIGGCLCRWEKLDFKGARQAAMRGAEATG
jgi:hypothetical protein